MLLRHRRPLLILRFIVDIHNRKVRRVLSKHKRGLGISDTFTIHAELPLVVILIGDLSDTRLRQRLENFVIGSTVRAKAST